VSGDSKQPKATSEQAAPDGPCANCGHKPVVHFCAEEGCPCLRYVKAPRAAVGQSIAFDLMETTDPELTCVACYRTECDREFRIRVRGTTAWYGIHTGCLDGFRARNESRAAVGSQDDLRRKYGWKGIGEQMKKAESQDVADGAALSDMPHDHLLAADWAWMKAKLETAIARAEGAEARVRELVEAASALLFFMAEHDELQCKSTVDADEFTELESRLCDALEVK